MVDLKFYLCLKYDDLKYYCNQTYDYYYKHYIKTYVEVIYFNYIYPIQYRNNCIRFK